MILPEDFAIYVGYDDLGVFVEVTHKPTGETRLGRPTAQAAVRNTQTRLIAEIREQFPAREEFRIDYLRSCDSSGNPCSSHVVSHIPSGTRRDLGDAVTRNDLDRIIDEIVTELWHEARTSEPDEKKS